ncbi:hypothetical protein ACNHYB_00730 [Isoptericola jiangsuensis]|uniref:hypothetical protein n=1 Tax=Isoptericola jiangsuensis TaxID=548579 RepID=UPI003AAC4BAA
MRRTDDDVEEHLRRARSAADLQAVDALVVGALPDVSRVLWRGVFWGGTEQAIVGYGDIAQPRPRVADVEWFLVGLAEQSRHLSLYVNAADDGGYLVRRYAPRLGRVKVGAAAITFRTVDDLDTAVLHDLLVEARRTALG